MTYLSPHFPVFWEKAEGANVWDVDGNRFLDLTSGFGVATAGFGQPDLVERYASQSSTLYHGMGDVHPTELKVRLCEELSAVTFERWNAGAGKSILGSSGFEAVEAALKTAYLHNGKSGVLAFEGSYHGLGFGALSVTGRREFSSPFRAQLKDFARFLPYPQSPDELPSVQQALDACIERGTIGALIVEPVQGRGGEIVPPNGFLRMLRDCCDRHGIVLIFDEIYTGFWRTGHFFACEAEAVVPDIICMGKALSGSFPISACTGKATIMDAWPISKGEALHTSTFLGHPVGCALALASLAYWQGPGIAVQVERAANAWTEALASLQDSPCVADVRGRGMLWGIELRDPDGRPNADLAGKCVVESLKQGLLLLAGGVGNNVLSLSPSLAVTREDAQWAAEQLGNLLQD